jgi:hypothetical protein
MKCRIIKSWSKERQALGIVSASSVTTADLLVCVEKIVLAHEPFDLPKLLHRTVKVMSPFAYKNKLQIVEVVHPRTRHAKVYVRIVPQRFDCNLPIPVVGDYARLSQVLGELSNSYRICGGFIMFITYLQRNTSQTQLNAVTPPTRCGYPIS